MIGSAVACSLVVLVVLVASFVEFPAPLMIGGNMKRSRKTTKMRVENLILVRSLLRLPHPKKLLFLISPAVSVQIDTRWGAEKTLFIPIRFLSNFCIEDNHDHVPAVPQVLLHSVPGESMFFWFVER